MIEAQVKAGQALGIPSEQIANGEFFERACSSKWATTASTSTPSADPAPSPKRTRVEVPHLVIVPNIMYYNSVHKNPSMRSPPPYIAAGCPAPGPATDSIPSSSTQLIAASWASNQPQSGCIPMNGGAPAASMQTSV